ncbi:MAG: ATP-binding protein [Thermodesulfobacteriota bacterium]|nr:ATP-binding protein [Thermodesulfobacteriota bacterium]
MKSKDIRKDYYKLLKRKILASMILVPAIPFILAVMVSYYYFMTSIQTKTVSKMVRIVEDHRQMIEFFLKERKSDLQFILDSYNLNYISQPEVLRKIFYTLQKESRAFIDLGVFNEDGLHVAYYGPYELAGKIYKDEPWFKEVMRKGFYISDVFLGFRQVPHFIISIVKKDAGETWVLRATIDTLLFNNLVEKVRIGKTGEAYILNKEGIFQTQRRSGGDLMDKDKDINKYLTSPEEIKTFIEKDITGSTYLYATAMLKDKSWLLVVRQEKADAFMALRSAIYLVILITILGGIIIVFLAFYMSNRVIRRMELMDEEKKQLSQQLVMAARLAEIGEMSAGFAHEINNPLQIIRSEHALIETILTDLKERGNLKSSEDTADLEDSLHQINVQIDRCAKITRAILKFARKKEHVVSKIDLRKIIPEFTDMIAKKACVDGIIIKKEIPENIPFINADSSELQQVLINLFNNAIDAITLKHGSHGGKLDIVVRTVDGKVEISVADNGCGIDPENIEKIFTPFFTTKPVGKGTGLGLSICFGIIDKMGGTIGVNSEKGVGTTFTITLTNVN